MENETYETRAASNGGSRPGNWGRRVTVVGLALAAIAGVGLVAARSNDFGEGREMRGFDGRAHVMNAGMGGGFAEYRFEKILGEIDATPEQSEKLKVIFASVRDGMAPMIGDFRASREKVVNLLGATTIDRAAAETLRSERVAAIDAASRTMTNALLDAAEILTPEQRTKLVAQIKAHGGHTRW